MMDSPNGRFPSLLISSIQASRLPSGGDWTNFTLTLAPETGRPSRSMIRPSIRVVDPSSDAAAVRILASLGGATRLAGSIPRPIPSIARAASNRGGDQEQDRGGPTCQGPGEGPARIQDRFDSCSQFAGSGHRDAPQPRPTADSR